MSIATTVGYPKDFSCLDIVTNDLNKRGSACKRMDTSYSVGDNIKWTYEYSTERLSQRFHLQNSFIDPQGNVRFGQPILMGEELTAEEVSSGKLTANVIEGEIFGKHKVTDVVLPVSKVRGDYPDSDGSVAKPPIRDSVVQTSFY